MKANLKVTPLTRLLSIELIPNLVAKEFSGRKKNQAINQGNQTSETDLNYNFPVLAGTLTQQGK